MRNKTMMMLVLAGLLAAAGAYAETHEGHEGMGHEHGSMGMEQMNGQEQAVAPEAAKAVEVGNKFCPVSREKVGEMGAVIQHEYNGKVYNFCCKACIKDFSKDPEKYSKIAQDEVDAAVAEPTVQ